MLRLNINGQNPIHMLLQAEQKKKCELIVANVPAGAFRCHESIPVGGLMQIVGIFWQNPLICGDFDFMMSIMSVLDQQGLIMLIPHLEEWVMQHATARTDDIGSYVNRAVQVYEERNWLMDVYTAVFQVGSLIFPGRTQSPILSVPIISVKSPMISVKSLCYGSNPADSHADGFLSLTEGEHASALAKKRNRELLKDIPALKEFEHSNGVEWWLWSFKVGELVLVDYRGKRIWGNLCDVTKMVFWDDIWEVKTWRLRKNGRLNGLS